MRTFALGQLTVCGARPEEMVDIAARAGYDAISPFLAAGGAGGLPAVPLKAGDPETVAMARRMADAGIGLSIGDGFALYDGMPMDDLRAGVILMAELGARAINAMQFDDDDARGFDRFCQLNQWAGDAGLTTLIEFTPLSRIGSLADALAYRERAGGTNIAILVDLLHLYRSGNSVSDLATLDPALLGGVQLCDGPLETGPAGYPDEAMYDRMVPGEGRMQARECLAMLPAGLVVDLEVPLRTAEQAGEDHVTRARRILEATRALL